MLEPKIAPENVNDVVEELEGLGVSATGGGDFMQSKWSNVGFGTVNNPASFFFYRLKGFNSPLAPGPKLKHVLPILNLVITTFRTKWPKPLFTGKAWHGGLEWEIPWQPCVEQDKKHIWNEHPTPHLSVVHLLEPQLNIWNFTPSQKHTHGFLSTEHLKPPSDYQKMRSAYN